MPDEAAKLGAVENALRLHRFRQTSDTIWVRGPRRGRRFVARIDHEQQTIEVSGRRATVTGSYADHPAELVGPEVEGVIRAVLDA